MSDLGRTPAPVALVDDNVHSARLFLRALAGYGYRARWLGNGDRAARALDAIFSGGNEAPPQLIVVDLKQRTGATAAFIARFGRSAQKMGSTLVAMVPSLAAEYRQDVLHAGAAAVFERHAERAQYHREIGALIEFWGRAERPRRVGS